MAKKTKSKSASAPPSSAPPPADLPRGSATPYLIGILIFGAGIVALLYARCSAETAAPTPQAQNQVAPPPSGAPVNADLPEFAPPPPPPEDAGSDAAADAGAADAGQGQVKTASTGEAGDAPAGPAGACANCGQGKPTSALVSAVRGTAGTAQGCHNRALRSGGVQGKMTVAVSVGSTGSVCGASITSDTVGNPALSSCVLGKFRGRSYPKPESGCVVINVPLNFAVK